MVDGRKRCGCVFGSGAALASRHLFGVLSGLVRVELVAVPCYALMTRVLCYASKRRVQLLRSVMSFSDAFIMHPYHS